MTGSAFADHMRDDVFWLGNPEFDKAFRDLTGDTSMTEAAWTAPGSDFPEFVNAQLSADGQAMVLTLRGPRKPIMLGDDDSGGPGDTTQLAIPLDAWDQFIADATQVRQRAEGGDSAFDKIAAGLADAQAYAEGDRDRGVEHKQD